MKSLFAFTTHTKSSLLYYHERLQEEELQNWEVQEQGMSEEEKEAFEEKLRKAKEAITRRQTTLNHMMERMKQTQERAE